MFKHLLQAVIEKYLNNVDFVIIHVNLSEKNV